MGPQDKDTWTCADAAELYGVRNWGGEYFGVSAQGEAVVNLRRNGKTVTISLLDVVAGLKDRGLGMPVLLRFGDILAARVTQLNEAFHKAIQTSGYRGIYRGVYPIKVNQQQQVLEDIAKFGCRYHHGMEAGSKAELVAALAYMHDPEAFIICNGYKDEEFIDLALYGLKMGLQTILVVETPNELGMILDRCACMRVQPRIGVRVKLSTRAGGRWTDSGGDRSVFGLTATQVIDVVDELRRREMLSCLQMLHYHLGSQIPNIRDVRAAIAEAGRFYVDLAREGAAMGILDIGGGLAVDYDGSHTDFASSSNYHVDEYCVDVIEGIMAVTGAAGVLHPTIVSESGRALITYHSVLLFNILDNSPFESTVPPPPLPDKPHEMLRNLAEVNDILTASNAQECFHDAAYYRDAVRSAFLHGDVTLRDRAMAEQIYWYIATRILAEVKKMRYVPEELRGLENLLADIYYGNFSVFQSLPDAWAIGQLFPIMPIHRLGERPTRLATLADMTCDCDGKIDRFIGLQGVKRALPLHELRNGDDYILAVFLVGAYQETLGDLHNLFGDTNVVTVQVDEQGEMEYGCEIHGDSVADVLSYVEFVPNDLMNRVRALAERAVRAQLITAVERREILEAYDNGLRGYTYYEQ